MKKRPFGLAPSPYLLLHLFAVCLFGTARVADGVSVRAVFDVSGVKGHITFQQLSPNEPGTIALYLSGLARFPGQRFYWLILSTPVASLPGSCQRLAMGDNPVFDPVGRIAVFGGNYSDECMRNQSVCAVGDLSGKHGQLNDTVQNVTFDDSSVDLFGRLSVIGRVVVVYLPGDVLACANIVYPANSISGVAPFRNTQSMFLGNIWFREFVFPRTVTTMVQTTVFADLVTTSMMANSTGHDWHVHVNAVGNGSMCSVAGPHYDPEERSLLDNYSDLCSPLNQSACEIGDLSGKSSPLDFSSGEVRLFYHDTNLPLEVSSENFSIVNRSVVVHERNGSEARVACADIRALPRRQAIASFDVEGVVGRILFEQSTPFDSTSVWVQLDGLQMKAEGYHIHDTPVGATQTDCDEQITGGHFDPWMVGGSPPGNSTTSDDYEAGDLSGKFGNLSNLPSINASFIDPFIPLFGRDSIVARSVVIHRPGGERWVCANVTHLQPNVTLVAAFNSSEVKGQVVFTQLQEDPLSEAAIFVNFFEVDIPLVASSASSIPSLAPTSTPVTLSSLSTSSDAQPMSQSSDFVMPSVTMTTVVMALSTSSDAQPMSQSSDFVMPSVTMTTVVMALSTSSDAQPMSQSSDFVMPSVTMTTVVMALSTSSDAQPMSQSSDFVMPSVTMTTVVMALSTSSDTQPMSQSSDFVMPSVTMTPVVMATSSGRVTVSSPLPTPITSSTTTAVLQASSTIISEETMTSSTTLVSSSSTEQPRLPPSSTTIDEADTSSLAPSPPLSSSVSPMLSTSPSDRLSSETSSSLEATLDPTPNMPPLKRRRRDDRDTLPSEYAGAVSSNRHRRQSLPTISWSIRDSCNSSPPVSTPGCGPSNPLVCSPGDLDRKHGQLAAGGPLRRVFTDPFLPLGGDQSVEGSVLVLELGPDMMLCASITPLSQTPTTPPATPSTSSPTTPPTTSPTTPPTAAPTSPGALTLPVIIGLVVVCVCLLAVCVAVAIFIVCICCCIRRRRKYGLWEDAETRRNGGYHSPDLELGAIRFTPSPSHKYAQTYRVVIDYEPLLGEHLPLKKGETVIVLEREREREGSASPTSNLGEAEGARDEMWKGKIGDAVGWFPAKNVEQVPLDEMNLSEDEREEAVKQIGIDRAAEVIIAASKSFSIQKPNEVQPSGKKAHRSRSFGANVAHTTSSRNSPAPSVSSVRANEAKLKELPRARSSATPLPWITVHSVTKDKIDSTPVSLKKHDQVGKHNSYVSDDINVVLEDISPLSAPPVSSVALVSAGNESRQQDDVPTMRVDKNDAAITSYEYRASFAYDGDNPDDLLFMEGDIVNVTWAEDSGWWYGTAGTRVGWFPGSFVEPVDMSGSEGEDGDDDGFLSDPPVDTPLDLAHVEIDVEKAENKHALEVDSIVMELQVDEKESHSQRTAEPLSTSSPVSAELELDHSPTAMGDFTAEIMTMFVNKNAEQASTLEVLAREQPQAPSPEGKKEDQTNKDESQRGTVESATSTSKVQPPSASPRKKLKKEVKEQKRQPQRRAPPPPPAGTKSKETSNSQSDHQTTAATQPATQIAQTTEPIQQTNSPDPQRETTALKPKRKPPAVPTEKKAIDTAPSSSLAAVGQETATQPVPVGTQEQSVAGKEQETTKVVLVPRRRAPGVPAGKQKPRSQMPHERGERARSARPAQQLRRMRPIPPPPTMPCPPPPIKPRTKLKQKQHSSSDDQPSEPAAISSSAPSSVTPVPAERKKANSSITAILQAALDEDDTGAKAETRAAPSAASPPVVAARQLPKKEDTVTARPPASAHGTTEPPQKQKPPKPPVMPKTKAAVDAWKRLSTSSFTEEVESGAGGVDRTRQTKKGTGAAVTDVQEVGKVQDGKLVPSPKPRPPARFSSLSDTAEASANLTDATITRKEADKPQSAPLETIAEKNNAGVLKPSYSPPLPKPREPGTADEGKPTEGPTKTPATAELNKREDVADKGRRVSGEKPAVPKKPDSLVKATRRQPPAPPPGSPVLGPQRRGSPFTVRKYKPPRPPQLPKLAKQTTAESTTNDVVSVPPGSQPAEGAVEHPAPAKEKPARPPPPTFPEQPRPFRAQPRNVPNTSTFFLGTTPTPAPRKNMPKSAEVAPDVEGDDREDPELSNLKRVISPYTAQRPDELTIRLGDCLSELEPPNSRGLCYGMLDNGQTGLYPADCVENW